MWYLTGITAINSRGYNESKIYITPENIHYSGNVNLTFENEQGAKKVVNLLNKGRKLKDATIEYYDMYISMELQDNFEGIVSDMFMLMPKEYKKLYGGIELIGSARHVFTDCRYQHASTSRGHGMVAPKPDVDTKTRIKALNYEVTPLEFIPDYFLLYCPYLGGYNSINTIWEFLLNHQDSYILDSNRVIIFDDSDGDVFYYKVPDNFEHFRTKWNILKG